jgi:hypothetical protein
VTKAGPILAVQRQPERAVTLGAVGLILVHLVLRAWAAFRGWFYSDDFIFLGDGRTSLDLDLLFTPHDSHLMPLGTTLSWIVANVGTYNWALAATITCVMQLCAAAACWFMLHRLFGPTPWILAPLAFYLFTPMSIPGFMWWSAALNAIPLHLAFFLMVAFHVTYLRTRRRRHAVRVIGACLLALAADPRGLLFLGVLPFLSLAYFTEGPLHARVWMALRRWRQLWLTIAILALGYASLFAATTPSPTPGGLEADLPSLARALVYDSLATSLVGGPWRWDNTNAPLALVDPPAWAVSASWVVIAGAVAWTALTRSKVWRGYAFMLAYVATIWLLLGLSEGVYLGAFAGWDLRYLSDSVPVICLTIGLVFLPIREAVDALTPRERGPRLTSRRLFVAVAAVVAAGSVWSTVTYVRHWHEDYPARRFVEAVRNEARTHGPTRIADVPVPDQVMSAFSYPHNLPSRLLRPIGSNVRVLDEGNDLKILNGLGLAKTAGVMPGVMSVPGPVRGCGHPVRAGGRSVPLAGSTIDLDWWVSVNYVASASGTVRVVAGETTRTLEVLRGPHTLFFRAVGTFNSVGFTNLPAGVVLCVDKVIVGELGEFRYP